MYLFHFILFYFIDITTTGATLLLVSLRTKYNKESFMGEVPKKKITLEGLRNAFKLYNYIKPYRIEYAWCRMLLKSL